MNRRWRLTVLCLLLLVGTAGRASAHESRPASLEITESTSGSIVVIWKRPLQGVIALHLVPHLSSGWIDRDADDLYAAPDYLIQTWRLDPTAGHLIGQAVTIEGLSGTITDALVRVRFADGSEQNVVLRGAAPSAALNGHVTTTSGRLRFVVLGVAHILNGPDHLLFVLGLILLVSRRRKLVATITGFTLGHTMTLIAASLLRLNLPLPLIDVLIALSILFLGPEILRVQAGDRSFTTARPWIVAVCFGLLHGLGFAAGLAGVGLQGVELVKALLQFNIGVELEIGRASCRERV